MNKNTADTIGRERQFYVTPLNPVKGEATDLDIIMINFNADSLITGCKAVLDFPDGFNLTGADGTLSYKDVDILNDGVSLPLSDTASDIALGVQFTQDTITITSGGINIPGSSELEIHIGTNAIQDDIGQKQPVNPMVSGDSYLVNGVFYKSDGSKMPSLPYNSLQFSIFETKPQSSAEGLFYLSDDFGTHGQVFGNGIGATYYDVGTLKKSPPTEKEFTYCGNWVQYYFDEPGFYPLTEIKNVYYHMWWSSLSSSGYYGYYNDGSYGEYVSSGGQTNTDQAKTRVDNFNLMAHKQNVTDTIYGNAIFNMGLKFSSTDAFPAIRNNPDQSSFVIFNLPEDEILLGRDSDSDGLNDYQELFSSFTNPEDPDTDNDGENDSSEYSAGKNPNEANKPPIFAKNNNVIKFIGEDQGGAADVFNDDPDYFGTNVFSISDLDGDNKEDIAISSPHANSNGFYDNGSIFIYSSRDHSLIKRLDGPLDDSHYGMTFGPIGDQDGDGLEDIVTNNGSSQIDIISSSSNKDNLNSILKEVLLDQDTFYTTSDTASISRIQNLDNLDADGFSREDIIVGSEFYNGESGVVYLVSTDPSKDSGHSIIKKLTNLPQEYLGQWTSSIEDMDGDGFQDIVASASNHKINNKPAGAIYILSSNPAKIDFQSSFINQITGFGDYSRIGQSVVPVNSRDGDKKQDILTGAYKYVASGGGEMSSIYVALIYSSQTGEILDEYQGDMVASYGVMSLDKIKDFNGDDKEEVLLGTVGMNKDYSGKFGIVRVYLSDGSLFKIYPGELTGDYFASNISEIGDQDADGVDDFIVGASGYSEPNKSRIGAGYLISTGKPKQIQNIALNHTQKPTETVDMNDYFSDPNIDSIPITDELTITAEGSDKVIFDYNKTSRQAIFSVPVDWDGEETIRLVATDSYGQKAYSNYFKVAVYESRTLPIENESENNSDSSSISEGVSPQNIEISTPTPNNYVGNNNNNNASSRSINDIPATSGNSNTNTSTSPSQYSSGNAQNANTTSETTTKTIVSNFVTENEEKFPWLLAGTGIIGTIIIIVFFYLRSRKNNHNISTSNTKLYNNQN